MTQMVTGNLSASPYSFGIVVSRFNELITKRLLDGAVDCLRRHGAGEESIEIIFCPGAFEIPQVAQQVCEAGKHDAVICLGCIIRGETPHFDYVANAVSSGLEKIALEHQTPLTFGVLTTDSLEQAINRAGAKSGNKGWDAALAAIEVADLRSKISGKKK